MLSMARACTNTGMPIRLLVWLLTPVCIGVQAVVTFIVVIAVFWIKR